MAASGVTPMSSAISTENVDHYVDDLMDHSLIIKVNISLTDQIDFTGFINQEKHPDLPLYLIGHSMGGMIAVRAVLRHPGYFSGMILNGPLIIPGPQVVIYSQL